MISAGYSLRGKAFRFAFLPSYGTTEFICSNFSASRTLMCKDVRSSFAQSITILKSSYPSSPGMQKCFTFTITRIFSTPIFYKR